jgi:hypothetical protein
VHHPRNIEKIPIIGKKKASPIGTQYPYRPDRFQEKSGIQRFMSTHGLWLAQVTVKPVRSEGIKNYGPVILILSA